MGESDSDGTAKVAEQEEASPRNVPEEARCPVGMSGNTLCGRPIHNAPAGVDEEPVCLMHSRAPDKDQGAFWEEFDRILSKAGGRSCGLYWVCFPEGESFPSNFHSSMHFR